MLNQENLGRSFGFVLVALFSLSIVSQVFAQDYTTEDLMAMSLEELLKVNVITASRKLEPIDDAPNVMYVITAEEIKKKGFKTLKDALQKVPGFGVWQKDIQYVIQVRGIAPNDNEKVAIMINGHSINGVTEPDLLNGPINLDFVERIEIIIGPGSVLYGAETLVAIVNLITKEIDNKEVALTVGENDLYSGTVSLGKKWDDGKSFFASLSYMEMEGYDAFLSNASNAHNVGLAEEGNMCGRLYPSFTVFGNANYDNWFLQAFSFNQSAPELHFHGWNFCEDGRWYNYTDHIIIRNSQDWGRSVSTFLETFYENNRYIRSVVVGGPDWDSNIDGYDYSYDLSQKVYGAEYTIRYDSKVHYFQAGIQFKWKQNRHNYAFNMAPDYPWPHHEELHRSWINSLLKVHDTNSLGFFISEEYRLNKKVNLVGAIRFDRDNIIDDDKVYISPRLSIVYKPTKRLTLKGMYNTATRFPTSWMSPQNQIFGSESEYGPPWASYNTLIHEPEQLMTTEFQAIYYLGKTRTSLNLYHQELKNFTSWFNPFTNVGDFDGNGVIIDIRSSITKNVTAWFDFAASDNDFSMIGEKMPEGATDFQLPSNPKGEPLAVPKYSINVGLDYSLNQNINLNGSLFWFSEQPMFYGGKWVDPGDPEHPGDSENPEYIGGEWTYANNRFYLDLALTWQNVLIEDIDFNLSVKNILDNDDLIAEQYMSDAIKHRGRFMKLSTYYRF